MQKKIMAAAVLSALAGTTVNAENLSEAVKQTIQTNPNVLVETNERLARNQDLGQAYAGYFPSVDASLGIGVERSDNPSTRAHAAAGGHPGSTRDFTRREAAVEVRQMIFDGFATSSEVERQKARINSQAYRVFGTSEAIALRATEVYLDVLRYQKMVALAQENYDAHVKVRDQIKKRAESGFGRGSDLDQATGRFALAESNLVVEQSNLRDAESNYLRVVGNLPGDLTLPVAQHPLPASLEEAINQALANHPVLKSAEADVDATYAQREAAKSAYYPRLHLEGGYTADENVDGQDGTNREDLMMLRLRYNLVNGGRDHARIQQTEHLINEAKEVRNNTHRQVVESIRLSWNSYATLQDQLDYLRLHMESSQKTYEAYQKQFNISQRTLLDLLDTENELFEAKRAYANGQFTELFARYRILAGTGQLLNSLGVALPEEATALSEVGGYGSN